MPFACEIDDLNDPELLDDTPIGRLRVVRWCGAPAVAIMDEHEPEIAKRVIYMLKPGENPLNAIYGKRTFEQANVLAAYNIAKDRREKRQERTVEDLRKDTRADVKKQLEKSWDGSFAEALAVNLGWRP